MSERELLSRKTVKFILKVYQKSWSLSFSCSSPQIASLFGRCRTLQTHCDTQCANYQAIAEINRQRFANIIRPSPREGTHYIVVCFEVKLKIEIIWRRSASVLNTAKSMWCEVIVCGVIWKFKTQTDPIRNWTKSEGSDWPDRARLATTCDSALNGLPVCK